MTLIAQRAARMPISLVEGADFSFGLAITENGVAYPWAGATVVASIVDTDDTPAAVSAWTFTPGVSGAAIMSLTDTQTTTLGVGTYRYSVEVTKAGITTPWLGGQLSILDSWNGGPSNSSATFSILTAPTVTVGIEVFGWGSAVLTADGNILTRAGGLPAEITRANLAADTAFTSRYVAQAITPATETTTNNIFRVIPATKAPWEQIEFGSGPQADGGSYDHVMVMGWNASVFADNGVNSTPNQSAILMGFEDGWYDGSRNGAEWWVGYYSPDRSVQLFRPFYTRILNDLKATTVAAGSNGVNTSTFVGAGVLNVASTTGYPTSGKVYVVTAGTPATVTFTGKTSTTFTGCTTNSGGGVMSTGGAVTGYTWGAGTILDIGTDGTGAFVVQAGPAAIPLTVTASIMTFKTTVGAAAVIVDGATTSTVQFKVATAASFQWLAPSVGQLQLIDKDGRAHILFTQGASSTAAQSDFTSSMKVQGRLSVTAGAAMATNATDGFFAINSCAGTPTGSPVIIAGSVPMIYDVTNNFLYAYNGGGWKKTAVFA